MSIKPYKKPQPPRFVGVLNRGGDTVETEDGQTRVLSSGVIPKSARLYMNRADADPIITSGRGDAICWNNVPIRLEIGGRSVILLGRHDPTDELLDGLVRFRDFLTDYGATIGSPSASSFSLLRRTLTRSLYVGGGEPPPLHEVIGGRVQGAVYAGHYGAFEAWDLTAAYAKAMGELPYPGRQWERYDANERLPDDPVFPVFQRAEVTVPDGLLWGPLPRHYRWRDTHPLAYVWPREPREYPVGASLRGLWTRDELSMAREAGARVVVRESWAMLDFSERRPFADWYAAIAKGRKLPGVAGALAKNAGNVLWSRFAMNGTRTRLSYKTGERVHTVEDKGHPNEAATLDVAELVTSTIRRRLYRDLLVPYGPRVLSVHTDGGLLDAKDSDEYHFPKGWRKKDAGTRLHYANPMTYAYIRDANGPTIYKTAGVEPADAPGYFWSLMHTVAPFPSLSGVPVEVVRDLKEHFPDAIADLMSRASRRAPSL